LDPGLPPPSIVDLQTIETAYGEKAIKHRNDQKYMSFNQEDANECLRKEADGCYGVVESPKDEGVKKKEEPSITQNFPQIYTFYNSIQSLDSS
jgi:hypothetical protein